LRKLRARLDDLSIGFPGTKSRVEIRMPEKRFEPNEVELFLDLGIARETGADEEISLNSAPSDFHCGYAAPTFILIPNPSKEVLHDPGNHRAGN
jgi:hypothetical protein